MYLSISCAHIYYMYIHLSIHDLTLGSARVSLSEKESNNSDRRYLPEIIITIPSKGTPDAKCLGTLAPPHFLSRTLGLRPFKGI